MIKRRHCRRTTAQHEPHEWQNSEISNLAGAVGAFGKYAKHRRDIGYWCTGKAIKEKR